jgi:hypothetical protein
MANRRELMTSGIALAALAATPPALRFAAAAETPTPTAPLGTTSIVIADSALPEAAAFGAAAAARGFGIRHFDGDVGPLWMNVVESRLRSDAVSMLGVTSAATLFCIETLARDYGARAVARIAARDVELDFAELLAADSALAMPPFAHVHEPIQAPAALFWRIETHSRFRSILAIRG